MAWSKHVNDARECFASENAITQHRARGKHPSEELLSGASPIASYHSQDERREKVKIDAEVRDHFNPKCGSKLTP